jgi:Tfp pilus assembly protein PilF
MRCNVISCKNLKVTALLLLWSSLTSLPRPLSAQAGSKSAELGTDLQRAQAALKANDQTAAAEQFRAVLKLDPSNAEAHANLGAIAFFHGDCPVAEKEFRGALHAAPSLTKAQALLAVCEKRLGEPSAQADLASTFAKLDDVKVRTQVGIELADFYYQRGDLGQTASVLYTLSTINPDNVDILFFEQRVYSELASSALDKLALLAPDSARMEQLIAERLINAGDLKGATSHYRKALQINPKLAGMHFELAESLMEGSPNNLETQKEATSELDAAIKVDGDSSKVEAELGRIAMLQSDLDGSFSHYRRAYQLNPEDPLAEIGLAELLKQQHKPEEAAKYLRMAIASDPLNAEAHYKLSLVDRELHLDEEQKNELKIFGEIRATKDKIKLLYQQMNPQGAGSGDIVTPDGAPQ